MTQTAPTFSTMTAQDIYELFVTRRKRLAPMHAKLVQVRDTVGGDIILPLPELDASEKSSVANLLLQDVEQKGARIASTFPTVKFPPIRWGFEDSMEKARRRGLVMDAWHDLNEMTLKMQRRAKHAVAYATSPVLIRPGQARVENGAYAGIPRWDVRDPISTYPPEMDPGDLIPADVIFSYLKPAVWVKQNFPGQFAALKTSKLDRPVRILQYCDAHELVTCAIGEVDQQPGIPQYWSEQPGSFAPVELERVANRVGQCLAVVPGRLGLDRVQGELEGVVGMYLQLAKIMALATIGVQKDIWPETWAVSHPNDQVDIVETADALRGRIGEVKGGTIVYQQRQLNQGALALMSYLERGVRVESSIPSELGGESSTNVRTGKRGDAVLSAAIDFPIQAIHQMFEASLREENKLAIAIDKAYFPAAKSFFISATDGRLSYTPADLWETDVHYVQYSQAGVDLQGLVVSGGQRVGIGTLSRRSFMDLDPLVDDPEEENDRVTYERLADALLQSIQTQAAQDPAFAPQMAKIMQAVITDRLELADAYMQVHQEAQQTQAAPPAPGSPEAQPGLGLPAQVPPPTPSVQNLSQLLREVRQRGPAPVAL